MCSLVLHSLFVHDGKQYYFLEFTESLYLNGLIGAQDLNGITQTMLEWHFHAKSVLFQYAPKGPEKFLP